MLAGVLQAERDWKYEGWRCDGENGVEGGSGDGMGEEVDEVDLGLAGVWTR